MQRYLAAERQEASKVTRLVRIGWAHDADSIKKVPQTKLSLIILERVFNIPEG